jgi:nucleotide-binding universal stress UspA family protein
MCPTDFSDFSNHALNYGIAFAEAYNAELHIVHVMEIPFLPSYSSLDMPEINLPVDKIEERCRGQLNELEEKFHREDIKIETILLSGVPFVEIVKLAREEEYDLIVVGTHGRGGLKHLLIGSVAEKVVRRAACPVLTVKHPEHEFVKP